MNIPSKGNIRIKINTLHMYAPVIKAIAASLYSIQDVCYPWEPWMPMPLGSFERGNKVLTSAPSYLAPGDKESIEGVLSTSDSVDDVYVNLREAVTEYYGQYLCSTEVFAC